MNVTPSRAATAILAVVGIGAVLNGAWMLLDATRWFGLIAARTGPSNAHLVRDVGAAYLTSGVALLWAAWRPAVRGPLTAVAAVFLGLHALTHVFEVLAGASAPLHLLEDLPGVHLPALLTIWLAAAALRRPAEAH